MSSKNAVLQEYVKPGKILKEMDDGHRVLVLASAFISIHCLITMFKDAVIQICEDMYQRFLAWQRSDCQKLFKSVDEGMDLGSLVIWIKNSALGAFDEIIDGGNRIRVLTAWIMGTPLRRRDGRYMHPLYQTSEPTEDEKAGPKEKFAKIGATLQNKTYNTVMEVRCIFVMEKDRWNDMSRCPGSRTFGKHNNSV